METIHTFPKQLVWPRHGQTPSATKFLKWVSTSSTVVCGTTFTAKTQNTCSQNFPLEKQPCFRWKYIKHDQKKCKWRKIGTCFAGFLAQNPLDFVSFSAAESHIFCRRRWVHKPGPVIFFCLEPFWQHLTTNNSCCEDKPVVHRCSAPQLLWWILPFRGSWCGFFAMICPLTRNYYENAPLRSRCRSEVVAAIFKRFCALNMSENKDISKNYAWNVSLFLRIIDNSE